MVAPAAPTCSCAGRGALNAKVRSVAPWGQGGKGSWEGAGGGMARGVQYYVQYSRDV